MNQKTIETKGWNVLKGEYNNKPMIVRLNVGCKDAMGKKPYTHRMGIAIPFRKPQRDGLPSTKEKTKLNSIEDDIFEIFQEDDFSIVSAVITTNNMMEFMLYVSDEKIAAEKVYILGAKHSKYNFQCYIDEDRGWEGYKEFFNE